MDEQGNNSKITEELTNIERKVLPVLLKHSSPKDIETTTGLKDIEVMRALQWLANKELIKLTKTEEETIILTQRGLEQKKNKLPEVRVLEEIDKKGKTTKNDLIKNKILDQNELGPTLGKIKQLNGALITKKETNFLFEKTPATKFSIEALNNTTQGFLEKNNFPLPIKTIPSQMLDSIKELEKRGSIKKDKTSIWKAEITQLGKTITAQIKKDTINYAEKITSKMLKDGSWKKIKLRSFDVSSKVPKITRGKKHFVTEAVEYIKNIWLELGFEEMQGKQTQSAFWDLDALFVPQDHPAREMQDTFYINKNSKIEPKILKKVKAVHETGADTGSKGWQTQFSTQTAERCLLRTHTTVISALTLSNLKKEDLPKKYFIVGKVFRNEALDWKHLFEFQQVDGIVVDQNANFSQLKGYLKEFFQKMGYTDVRIRPAHFPYTEPSAEVEAYNPYKKEWVEMGGSGIFRPEVTKTLLGFECPVLAWGLGMERVISSYYQIKDLREIYQNDLNQLKNMKTFIR